MTMTSIRVGTRGSPLALAQAAIVVHGLTRLGVPTNVVIVKTAGDGARDHPSSELGRGVFVTALERALTGGDLDIAVQSAKDLPIGAPQGLAIAAVLRRGDPRDALISHSGAGLSDLPAGARIGTESPRRRAFLLAARPDCEVVPIRGNVDRRLTRLDAGAIDAIVLAVAGLERLGLESRITETMTVARMTPAVGQGALAIQVRLADAKQPWAVALDHAPTHHALRAERAFLEAMGGGCQAPFAALATGDDAALTIDAAVLEPDGCAIFTGRARGPASDPESLGKRIAGTLLAHDVGRQAPGTGP